MPSPRDFLALLSQQAKKGEETSLRPAGEADELTDGASAGAVPASRVG